MNSTTMTAGRQKTCERCGAEFGCSVAGKCWCMDELCRMPMPKAGEAKYSDCLCRSCLCRSCLREVAVEAGVAGPTLGQG